MENTDPELPMEELERRAYIAQIQRDKAEKQVLDLKRMILLKRLGADVVEQLSAESITVGCSRAEDI